ncbi:iron-containing alcohol dehydrogenase [Bordetella genomosp. 9]|uniref:Alcohol dehydrogenase n=1 Tax=Bordetella genomosp. 9 TaxID=1416803 RepID=A0A1W6Z0C9_9BORD|nr:iron-containing alcohol dehydrogenase [Bordetella genomosp. 9]ARP86579.1 alcohol dehydrogenase [Bordetella genomosp. 9]
MQPFAFHAAKSVLVAPGAALQLADHVARLGARSVLVVTDPGVARAGLLEPALEGMRRAGLGVHCYAQVVPEPPVHVVLAAAEQARATRADCIVGFGGGSSLDTAKLAALLASGEVDLESVYGVDKVRGARLPLILVPTTAGTGSEVTPIAIVTTGENMKQGVVSPVLLPDVALLDADLTLGLPRPVTAATGIDAMVHAIEAYTSRRLKNPLSDSLAREALRLLSANIRRVCDTPGDRDARQAMLIGACMAGMAFANAPVGAVHALAYPVGARFHVPHGLSNSLVLGPVLRFNLPAALPQYEELAEQVLPRAPGSPEARAVALIEWLEALPAAVGLPSRLTQTGITANDVDALADDAMLQTRLLVNNPRELSRQDAVALYRQAL